ENPCDLTYFYDKEVARNILASTLGIIAKSGADHQLKIAVTDLNTTQPLSGVEVEIYNFQQQLINSQKTDGKGLVSLDLKQKPFLLIAKHNNQRGYLKLDDGSSLSLSKFDVSGKEIQKGIKGYIYGERGVWRPGDSLFISFILEDKNNVLPENHPVQFEMYDPNAQLKKRMISTKSSNGFYSFKTATEESAPTGNWLAKIRIGGSVFSKSLRIETVKPNRLKINIDFGTKLLTSQDKNIVGKLNIKWLHGAIAKNLRAQVDVTLNSISTQFEKFKDYTFNDPTRTFQSEELTIFNDRVDDAGNANINTDFRIGQIAPGMLKANFQTRAFEEGGDFSIDQFSIPYTPFNYYVGVKTPKGDKARGMLLTDTDHTIEIVTVDFNGKPVTRKNLSASVYKVQWRWWWESGSDNLGSYAGSNSHTSILTKNFDTDSNGLGSFDFKIKYPEWGRYLIRITDKDGHSCGKTVYVDWPGWAGRSQRDNPGGASMLMFSAEKEKYQVGEKAKISFPSSLGGRALVSIENGTRVQDMFWVETTDKETIFEFEIKNSMTPNVFIYITLLQKHNQTINDLPIRLYGVIPITVEDAATRLKPALIMPKELRSEEKFTLQVKEENGKPMTYTVAIVEEGLLDLTRFKTPDPWSTFYAKEALGVKTWDMYDFVLGAYGGKLEQAFAIGGDESLLDNGKKKANRFKPVVKFIGPFELKANEIKSHNIHLTKYIGAVRTMVIAGNKTAYGFTDQSTVIKNPMMLLATMPRVVGPSEKLKLPVSLFAMDENIKSVDVSISTNSLFEILGERTKTLEIKETGEYDLSFDIAATANLGIGKIKVKASSGQLTTDYDIEIDLRPSNPKITRSYSAVIKSGESWEHATQAFGINGTNSASLEISSLAPMDFGRRLKYLLDYPHGCIEQTTSTAFPQLFLGNVMELSTEEQNKTQKNIEAALERFISFQLPNGGFSYWPGNNAPSDWGTSYAGHFLLEAEKKGYSLPIGMKDHWIDYQSQKARNWSNKKENWSMLDQAYRLYTLALADAPEIGAMNRLRELPNLSKQAMWRLAAAYTLAGKQNIATAMIDDKSWQLEEDNQYTFTFGSMTRDYAMILETYSLLKRQNDALPLMEMISKKLSSNEWMSTQACAYSLIAMVKFAGDEKLNNKKLDFEFSLAGLSDRVKTDKSIKKLSKILTNKEIYSTKVTNHGKSLIYANLFIEGIPLENTLQAESKNLEIEVQYETLDNKDIDPAKIEQGMDFKAIVTIQNPGILGDYKDLALTQIFPSGWEIHNTRMLSARSEQEMDTPDYQDIRDDRVYSYLDIKAGKSKSFVVLLNAAYIGKYFLPSVVCEAMYDSRIHARTEGKWVKVIEN
ncbi:MAG: hypothetical protein JW729_01215, partial [Bacteroidales bacterium]|nr:hypothetical protein [Bacteroidales bacterium]